MHPVVPILGGALGLWLGMPNPLLQLPAAALLYPAALVLVGAGAYPTRGATFRAGWLTGFLGGTAALYWVAVPVHLFGMLPWALALPCAALLGAYLGVFAGLFALLARAARAFPVWAGALALGLGWYLLEWLRGWLFTGFPWLPLAAAFAPWPCMLQGASVVGAFGLGGVLAGLSALAALGAWRRAVLLLAALAGGGAFLLHGAAVSPASGTPGVDVALIQGNVDQRIKWNPALQRAVVERYVALSEGALRRFAAADAPRLTIWPETALPFELEWAEQLAAPIQALALASRTALVVGTVGRDPASRRYFNRACLIQPTGAFGGRYEKEHLVPFGEYAPPFLDLPFLRPLLQGVGAFVPGRASAPLRLEGQNGPLELGVLICYESIFPALARARVAAGASLLVNISNDAWFGRTPAAAQHLHASLLRAVELGRPLLRATNTGISAFIDARGRVLAQSGLFEAGALTARMAPARGRTLFFVLAPWLPGAALAAFAAVCGYGAALGRRRGAGGARRV